MSQPAPAPGAEEVRSTLAEVLSRPEFQLSEPGPVARLLARISDAIDGVVMALLRRIPFPDAGGSVLPWLIRGALAIAAALLIFHLVRTLARGDALARRRQLRAATSTPRGSEEADWDLVAERAAESGRYQEAVLAVYRALLGRLSERGLIRLDPAKTPGDYRRELRGRPPVAGAMDHFLSAFEPAVFGGREPDRDAFVVIRDRAREAARG